MKTKTASKTPNVPKPAKLPTNRKEFEAEGELGIAYTNGAPSFIIDSCHLSELVNFHFKPDADEDGVRLLGRCKILIIPVKE